MSDPIIVIKDVHRHFPVKEAVWGKAKEFVHALNGVSLELAPGKTAGLVGESGCGKTTLGRLVVGLDSPTHGEIYYQGLRIKQLLKEQNRLYRKKVQIIFQNPYGALNPRQRIEQTFKELINFHEIVPRSEVESEVDRLLKQVGIDPDYRHHYPFEFSGGQRQRICIARALAVQPEVVVCDEPVSALDVSIQSQILKLLKELQQTYHLTYLFISHDLSVVYHLCDTVAIMYLGMMMESGSVEAVYRAPRHPYTQALLSAIPIPDPIARRERIILGGEVPHLTRVPPGCPFYSRCPQRMSICEKNKPPAIHFAADHQASCWLYHKQ